MQSETEGREVIQSKFENQQFNHLYRLRGEIIFTEKKELQHLGNKVIINEIMYRIVRWYTNVYDFTVEVTVTEW